MNNRSLTAGRYARLPARGIMYVVALLLVGAWAWFDRPARELIEDEWRDLIDEQTHGGFYARDVVSPQLAARYPDDLQVQAAFAREQPDRGTAFDKLLKRHPPTAWLIAQRLVHVSNSFKDGRLAGNFERRLSYSGKPSLPEKSGKPPSFTPEELKHYIDLARRGQKLEPDNCFFDWMLIAFLIGGYQDDEAMRVLRAASRKPRFDAHEREMLDARLHVEQLVQPGRLSLEHHMQVHYGTYSTPHRFLMMHVARMTGWRAWKMELAGNVHGALQLRGDLARLATPLLRGRNNTHTARTGIVIQGYAWGRIPANGLFFAALASEHGETALSQESAVLSQENLTVAGVAQRGGFPSAALQRLHLWSLFHRAGLVQLALCVFIALLLACLLWRAGGAQPTTRDMVAALAITGIFSIAGFVWLAGAGAQGITGLAGFMRGMGGMAPNTSAFIGALLLFVTGPILISAAWCTAVARWRRSREVDPGEKLQPHQLGRALSLATTFLTMVVAGTLAGVGWLVFQAIRGAGWAGAFAPNSMEWVCLPMGLLATMMLYGAWFINWRWFSAPAWRGGNHYALRCHQQTVAWWVVLSCALSLGIAHHALPDWNAERARFERTLQQGEVTALLQP